MGRLTVKEKRFERISPHILLALRGFRQNDGLGLQPWWVSEQQLLRDLKRGEVTCSRHIYSYYKTHFFLSTVIIHIFGCK